MNADKPIVGTFPDLLHPQSRGVISHWLFNEGMGSQLGDSFPDRNHGTFINMGTDAVWVPGKFGWAVRFNGDDLDGYISIPHANDLLPSKEFSFFVRIRPNFSSTNLTSRPIFSKSDVNTDGVRVQWQETIRKFRFRLFASGAVNLDTAGVIFSAGSWHTLGGSYDGSVMRIYWDGLLNNSAAQTGLIDNSNVVDLRIGAFGVADDRRWIGDIDTFILYNRALLSEEFRALDFNPYSVFPIFSPASFFVPVAAGSPWYYYAQH